MSDYCANCKKHTYFWETECDMVCDECGLCLGVGIIDEGLERRNFSEGPNHSRGSVSHSRSMKVVFSDRKLATMQKYIEGSSQHTFGKNLDTGDMIISKLCYSLGLKNVENDAKAVFEDFMEKVKQSKETKGEGGVKKRKRIVTYGAVNLKPLSIACIYVACKDRNIGKTLREIIAYAECDTKSVVKFVKKIGKMTTKKKKSNSSSDVLTKIIEGLDLWKVSMRANEILRTISSVMEGKRPATLAATSVLIACREAEVEVNPEDLAIFGFCAESTLHNTIKTINKKKINY